MLQLPEHPLVAPSRDQTSPLQPVAKVPGSVLGEEQPADSTRVTADPGKKGVNASLGVGGGKIGAKNVVSRRPVGDDPRGLLVNMDADTMLVVKQTEIFDVVATQGIDQGSVIHVSERQCTGPDADTAGLSHCR